MFYIIQVKEGNIMNKEIIEFRMQQENLQQEIYKISAMVHDIEEFLKKDGIHFKKKESLQTLKKIGDYCKIKSQEKCEMIKRYKDRLNDIQQKCEHEIIFNSCGNHQCLICNKCAFVFEYPKTTQYVIDDQSGAYVFDENRELAKQLESMIDKAIESPDFISYIEENLEEFDLSEVKVLKIGRN